jgi:NDP-sugar pyrophosphorylase family protein
MAGGLGSRLQPLTDDCPKPLLKVGGRPILETIMLGFMEHGFHNFHLSVNYKAEMVEAHFGDGSRWGANIRYLRETTKLGTAGCLSLLPERPERTFFVMNGDLLTRVNFERMLAFHHENRSMATMGIREHEFEVPYGVVEMKNHRLLGLKEKPVQRFFVNAGVYAFEPETLDCIGSGEPLDMPEFFERIMARDLEASVFPIHEYWLDIGRHGDYDRANGDFLRHFED